MPFSQIMPPSSSPTESERLFYTSVSLLLSHIQGYCFTPVRMAAIQKSTSDKCWRGCWRKGNPLTVLVGMQTSTATMENSVEIP